MTARARTARRSACECPYRGFSLPSRSTGRRRSRSGRFGAQRVLQRSSAITCSAWWRSVGPHRRRSCTGCSACTVRPRGAARGHSGRFHPGSSGRRIRGSSDNASRPAPSRRSSTSPAASPDLLPERDDAPSCPPCRHSFALTVAAGQFSPVGVGVPRLDPRRQLLTDLATAAPANARRLAFRDEMRF
jgi:hypothetical protein